jgi:hypothetical protein
MLCKPETHGEDAALQAYLEADPATRTTKDEYIMRYQRFAKSGLDKAIQKYEGLYTYIGVCINALIRAQCTHVSCCPGYLTDRLSPCSYMFSKLLPTLCASPYYCVLI